MKKRNRTGLIIIVFVAWLALMASLAVLADARRVRFYVSGEQEMTVEQGTEYTEPGIYAVSHGRLFGEGRKKLNIRTQGEVDTSTPGKYTIDYIADTIFGRFSTRRVVEVVDTIAPEIELLHVEGYKPDWISGYQEEGYVARDNNDGDITDKVQCRQLADKIVYTVSDSAGNSCTVERPLPDFSDTPLISLTGGEYIEIYAGDEYVEPGYSCIDGLGNDLTSQVQVEGRVLSDRAGEYFICYSLMSKSGVGVSVTRCVTVLPKAMPAIVEPEGRTIYLTFDDGPGPYTARLLDVLSRYGVKATFFVTAANENYFDLIGRAYREGHSIGVHTSSHNYREIYSSEEAWFADFNNMQEIICSQTGEYTGIFRFPGGSSNTVSNFNPGIMTRLAQTMSDLGYRYFDWNVSSGDAGETDDTQEIIDNIISGCYGMKTSVVLQHDIKDYSVNAVEQVIIWGLNNGYSFRALDMSSPVVQHGINN